MLYNSGVEDGVLFIFSFVVVKETMLTCVHERGGRQRLLYTLV